MARKNIFYYFTHPGVSINAMLIGIALLLLGLMLNVGIIFIIGIFIMVFGFGLFANHIFFFGN